jgi:pimeloyl-ACP methyl ester carboxylesterase
VVTETDLALDDGRTLHVNGTGTGTGTGTGDGTTGLAVFWQHGTPSTGAPPEPLFAAAAERGIRWVSHDRPGYGGSTPHPGRDVASAGPPAGLTCSEDGGPGTNR